MYFEARSCRKVSASRKNRACMLLAVCAGEARVAASGPGESSGPDEVFEDPMSGRRQVMMSAHLMSDPLFGL